MLIRAAEPQDAAAIHQHDPHISPALLQDKISRREVFAAYEGEAFAGWLRYNLFWDMIPFVNMLFLLPEYRGKGHGRALMCHWEQEMKRLGHQSLMTSSLQNEVAQHFYVALGYRSIGGFVLPGDALEIFFFKEL